MPLDHTSSRTARCELPECRSNSKTRSVVKHGVRNSQRQLKFIRGYILRFSVVGRLVPRLIKMYVPLCRIAGGKFFMSSLLSRIARRHLFLRLLSVEW